MNAFEGSTLIPQAFSTDIRKATHDLADLLVSAGETGSATVETTHVLMCLAKVQHGATQKALDRMGLTIDDWQSGLYSCTSKGGGLPPAQLTRDSFDQDAQAMLADAIDHCNQNGIPRITEPVLLLYALRHATAALKKLCASADIDLDRWCADVEDLLKPVVAVSVFVDRDEQPVQLEAFSGAARKVIRLMQSEGESLGHVQMDPRHLLAALLAQEGGVLHYGLHQQGIVPRKVRESNALSLQRRSKRTRSVLPLDRERIQPMLRRLLVVAGEQAGRDHEDRVTERHLCMAFLAVESTARRVLEDEDVDIQKLQAVVEGYEEEEDEDENELVAADIDTVRERLHARLVGQDETIARILPHIQRMRFGFRTPGRPVGVFLFCGQSGSGKTEMAKELARAVYGSEENLIFLEMGQFHSPESMNNFVGAPPGYVGYGEGKLTNGLRDKPRAVVLFDEVEKANARVLDALLRFLDEGKIDDPAGPVRDGTQCIVILTSNVGAVELSQLSRELKDTPNRRSMIRKKLREEFRKHNFRVEFLNRVDELLLFRTLEADDYAEIATRMLKTELERMRREREIDVVLDDSVTASIGGYCKSIDEGARAAHRLTQSMVVTPVIDFVLSNSCSPPVKLKVRAGTPAGDPEAEPEGVVELANG